MPSAKIPDRPVRSGPILDREAEKIVAKTRKLIEGKLATYVEDGWTNISKTHLDTSILSVESEVRIFASSRSTN
jgi:hypothetical protein